MISLESEPELQNWKEKHSRHGTKNIMLEGSLTWNLFLYAVSKCFFCIHGTIVIVVSYIEINIISEWELVITVPYGNYVSYTWNLCNFLFFFDLLKTLFFAFNLFWSQFSYLGGCGCEEYVWVEDSNRFEYFILFGDVQDVHIHMFIKKFVCWFQ